MGNKPFFFFDQAVIRVPLLPYTKQFKSPLTFIDDSVVSEAIFLSSEDLYKEIRKIKLSQSNDFSKLLPPLINYYNRMRTRCTPFGLNAGCSTIQWGGQTKITINNRSKITRLDMGYLSELKDELLKSSEIRKHLIYFSNNSVYKSGTQTKYIEDYLVGKKKHFRISGIDSHPIIQEILKYCSNGQLYSNVCKHIKTINRRINVEELMQQLIENRLLFSELEPPVTGEKYQDILLRTLDRIIKETRLSKPAIIQKKIKKILELFSEQSTRKIGFKSYKDVFRNLKQISDSKEQDYLQIDSYLNTEGSELNKDVQNQLVDTINFLNKITPNSKHRLDQFVNKFRERYEEAEIPLLKVFDPITGIIYQDSDSSSGSFLLSEVSEFNQEPKYYSFNVDEVTKILLNKVKGDSYKIELYEEDFTGIDFSDDNLPPTMSVLFSVVSKDCIHFQSCSGPSGVHLMNRFSNAKPFFNLSKQMADHEKEYHLDKIIAEVVHLPQPRAGNVICNPGIIDYEIPILNRSFLKKDFQVSLSDIFLKMNKDKLVLYSKKHKRDIIPRLSHAYLYRASTLPLYRFLGDFQSYQYNKTQLKFEWRGIEHLFVFKPRVEFKKNIINPARWDFKEEECSELLKLKQDDLSGLKKWQEKWKLPNAFMLIINENEIYIDLNCRHLKRLFINTIKENTVVTVFEILTDINNLLVFDKKGQPYLNEIIAFIGKNKKKLVSPNIPSQVSYEKTSIKRMFLAGEEWLYYKLYMGVLACEKILIDVIFPCIQSLMEKRLIQEWFFVRYSDPEFHLRLRFKVFDDKVIPLILKEVRNRLRPYVKTAHIHKIVLDSYSRELERYGFSLVVQSEWIFHIDSTHTLYFISTTKAVNDNLDRLLYSIGAVNDFLSLFELSIQEKSEIIGTQKRALFIECGSSKELKNNLSKAQRKYEQQITDFIENRKLNESYSLIKELLAKRNIAISGPVKELLNICNQEQKIDLITSYVHMMLNRLIIHKPRITELFIYDLLHKYYISYNYRSKNN